MPAKHPERRSSYHAGHKPFQPALGTDFGRVSDVEAKTRDFLARAVASIAAAGVAVTGVFGLATGNFVPVVSVWAIAGPIIGGVMSYYFGPQRST